LKDVRNTVVSATYSVALEARKYDETSSDRNQDGRYTVIPTNGVSALAGGSARLTAYIPGGSAIHHTYIRANWTVPNGPSASITKSSNLYTILNRPANPTASLNPGTYTGNRQVTLSNPNGSSLTYYLLQTANADPVFGMFTESSKSFALTADTVLSAIVLQNNVYSEEVAFRYVINPAQVVAVGGGGGGGGGSSSIPSLDADGKMAYTMYPPRIDWLIMLNNSNSTEITMDARTNEKLDRLAVKFDADLVPKFWSRNKSLVITSNELTMTFPPNAFQVKDESQPMQFNASFNPLSSSANFTALSSSYDVTLTEGGGSITTFGVPVKATFAYDPSKVKNKQNVAVFVMDEKTGEWTRVGGTINDGSNTITAELNHFSKYAVLEKLPAAEKPQQTNTRTFVDIQTHWAKLEIEKLAAAQIIDGVDDSHFQPDANMTRAQFVTLIAKALRLPTPANAKRFFDVADDAWYKNAVYAAQGANIVSGVSDSEFAPDAPVTREQMAVIMVNAYLHAKGKPLSSIVITQEVKYADEGRASGWAREYVRIASALGLMNGTGDGMFAPAEYCTRAQAAAVLYRMLAL
jgi:hypothetical protein